MSVIDIQTLDEWNTFITNTWNSKIEIFVLDCWAEYCGPCKSVKPRYASLAEKYPDIPFLSVDIEKVQRLSDEFTITSIPTFLIFKKFKIVKRIIGADIKGVESGLNNAISDI